MSNKIVLFWWYNFRMTFIPGTGPTKSQQEARKEKEVENQSNVLTSYKKETRMQKKMSKEAKTWDKQLIFWIKVSGVLSAVSILLGFLIYKSFFILAVFIPIAVLAIWYTTKFIEDWVSKFDSFSK